MDTAKQRTVTRKREKEMSKNKKKSKIKQAIYMIVSVTIMIFVIYQGYFLVRYTLGYEVNSNNLIIYKWINRVEDKNSVNTYTNEESTKQK